MLGIGTDIIEIERVRQAVERNFFKQKVLRKKKALKKFFYR